MSLLDNGTVAILQKVNELAERYGISPLQFIATIKTNSEKNVLSYECPPMDRSEDEQFYKMLTALGASDIEYGPKLVGDPKEIYDALLAAIEKAPRARKR